MSITPDDDALFKRMPMADVVNLRQTVCMLIEQAPESESPTIRRPGLTLRCDGSGANEVCLEVGDDPQRLAVLILAAQDWLPWSAGKWSAPSVYGLRGWYSETPVYRKALA